jgi:glycosyltransferase involved in cell wall biosynthesis
MNVQEDMSSTPALIYLASARIPSNAANGVQTMNMCAAFADNQYGVTLFCRSGDPVPDVFAHYGLPASFTYAPMPPRGPRGLRTLSFLSRVVRGALAGPRPAVYFGRDVYALAALSLTGVPVVLEVHRTMRGYAAEQRAFRMLMRRPSFKRLVVISEGMRKDFMEVFPELPADKILVAPGGARDGLASPQTIGDLPPLEKRPGKLQVGYVGTLYAGRGLEMMIELARRAPEMDFQLVGGDPKAISEAKALGLPANMRFYGHVPPAAVASYLQQCDVLLAPYQRKVYAQGGSETSAVMSPLKLFEYMSQGRPILCSDLPVIREVLQHGVTALLLPPDDADAWAAALEQLASQPALRKSLGEAARARYLERHTWKARAARVLAGVQGCPQ